MLGIDISDHAIKIVELHGSRTLAELRALSWKSLPAGVVENGLVSDVRGLTGAVKEALAAAVPTAATSREAVLGLSERQTFLQVLKVPRVATEETDEAVIWSAVGHVPYSADAIYVDWQALPEDQGAGDDREVLVATVERRVVDRMLAAFKPLKIDVVAMEPSSQAIARAIFSSATADVRDILIIDIGTTTNLIFFDQGLNRLSTSLPLGGEYITRALMEALKLSHEKADQMKATFAADGSDSQVAEIVRNKMSELMTQIQRLVVETISEKTYLRQPKTIILTGGSSSLLGLREVCEKIFAIPVRLGNPWVNISMKSGRVQKLQLTEQDALFFSVAAGLALRPVDRLYVSPGHEINVLPPEDRKNLPDIAFRQAARSILTANLIGALIIVMLGISTYIGALIVRSLAASGQSTAQLQQHVDHNRKLRSQAKRYNDFLRAAREVSTSSLSWSQLLLKVTAHMPAGFILTSVDAYQAERRMVVYGVATSREAMRQFEQGVTTLPEVSQVISPFENYLAASGATFRLEVFFK